jgi:uncharacterized membrane protein YoaK (UPF0700 family)
MHDEANARPDFGLTLAFSASLALNAGFINAIALLSLFSLAVSHVTGSTSNLGAALGQGDFAEVRTLALVIAAYFTGNVISGFLIHDQEIRPGRRYSAALLVQALLIAVGIWFFDQDQLMATYLLACACGLQNGMATRYSGATVRTSHMSGIVTDLGILLGQRLRGKRVGSWRAQLLLTLFTGFVAGGILAGLLFEAWDYRALWLSVVFTILLALSLRSLLPPFLSPGSGSK